MIMMIQKGMLKFVFWGGGFDSNERLVSSEYFTKLAPLERDVLLSWSLTLDSTLKED
jgi:hypothetical protein